MIVRGSLALALIVIGLFVAILGSLLSFRALEELRYVPVEGRVLASEIRKVTTTLPGSQSRSQSWRLFVDYEYWVEGVRHVSDLVASSQPGSNASLGQEPSDELRTLAARYAQGDEIVVYVSPSSPDRSVLIRASFGGLPVVAAGLLACALGVALRLKVL